MKKIINKPSDFVEESIDGLVKSHPDVYAFAPDNKRVITRATKASNKVGIVTGGGSGHLPVFTGYVGKGLLDACAVGSVFASPSVDQIASAIRNADNGNGVLCVIGNYGGDVMNFEMACEIVVSEGIKTKTVIVADDIASASNEEKLKRRGIAGMIFVFKVAGSIAETGASLEETFNNASLTNENIRTLGVAVSPCILPEAGKPTFDISEEDMEMGMGIHGEPGVWRGKLKTADEIANEMVDMLLADINPVSGARMSVMVNSLGATPPEELYILYRIVKQRLEDVGIKIVMPLVGRYATSMEMTGVSFTFCELDAELEVLLLAPAHCAFWTVG